MSSRNSATDTTFTIRDAQSIADINRGPITTRFKPPASCRETLTSHGDILYVGRWWSDVLVDLSCFPTGSITRYELATRQTWASYYYSPAMCPLGWVSATTFTSISLAGPTVVLSLGPATTAVLCCPAGFTDKDSPWGHQCTSNLRKGETITYITPEKTGNGWDIGTVRFSAIDKGFAVYADGVPIWWQSSDSEVLASAALMTSTPTLISQTPTSSAVTHTSNTSAPFTTIPNAPNGTPLSSIDSRGLSIAAKIGVGVSIPLAVLAFLGMGLYVRWWLRQHHKEGGPTPSVHSRMQAELDHSQQICEIDTPARHELPGG